MDVKPLKGIAAVSIAKGEKVGAVEDVVVDTQERRVAAFKIESGGLIRKDHCYVPFGAVQSIGDDAIMIPDETVLQQSYGDRASGYLTLGKLGDVRVVTETGIVIGHVTTVHFDPTEGQITDFEVGKGGIGGVFSSHTLIGAANVTSIGEDIMVVPASAVAAGGDA